MLKFLVKATNEIRTLISWGLFNILKYHISDITTIITHDIMNVVLNVKNMKIG